MAWFPDDDTARFGILAVAGAFVGTIARARYWYYPTDLMTPAGVHDPRAGRFNVRKALSDLIGMPAIAAIVGGISMAFAQPTALMFAIAALVGVLSTGFIYSFFDKAVQPLISVGESVLKRIFGTGK
jgi:hypothetical protein